MCPSGSCIEQKEETFSILVHGPEDLLYSYFLLVFVVACGLLLFQGSEIDVRHAARTVTRRALCHPGTAGAFSR